MCNEIWKGASHTPQKFTKPQLRKDLGPHVLRLACISFQIFVWKFSYAQNDSDVLNLVFARIQAHYLSTLQLKLKHSALSPPSNRPI